MTVSTDASDLKWGAVWHKSPTETSSETGGWFCPSLLRLHITKKEALGALWGLQSYQRKIPPGARVHLQTDSLSLYHALRRLRTKSPALLPVIRELASLAAQRNWVLTPHWIPSEENLADKPSRDRDFDDYRLDPRLLFPALKALPLPCLPTIDLMTTETHSQFRRFVSRTPQPNSIATDLFSMPLSSLPDRVLYVNPPWGSIQRLLLHLSTMRSDQMMVIVTPHWDLQPWYRHLDQIRSSAHRLPPQNGTYLDPLGEPMPSPRWSTDLSLICASRIAALKFPKPFST